MNKILSLTIMMLLSFNVFAAEEENVNEFSDSDTQTVDVSQHKKLNIKFEDELVKSSPARPEVEFIFQKADFNFKRMIKLRENFIPEVQKGKDQIRGIK